MTLARIPNPQLRKLVARYGATFWEAASAGLAPLLLGEPGTYKSCSAAVLARQIHEVAHVPVQWCDVPIDLVECERKRFQTDTDERIHLWKACPWLVLDDFALVRINTWTHDVLCEIVLARYNAARPTCYTGNLDMQSGAQAGLNAAVGAQVARRVLEGSVGYRFASKSV